jgi:hypothetical protein
MEITLSKVSELADKISSASIEEALGLTPPSELYSALIPTRIERETMYRVSDAFELRFIYFSIPKSAEQDIMLVGPYVT